MTDLRSAFPWAPRPVQGTPPPSSIPEIWDASRTLQAGDNSDAGDLRIERAYDPIVTAINAYRAKEGKPALFNPSHGIRVLPAPDADRVGLAYGYAQRADVGQDVAKSDVLAEIRRVQQQYPGALKGVPDSDEKIMAPTLAKEQAARAQARDVLDRSDGWLGTATSMVGGISKTLEDPAVLAQTVITGGEGGVGRIAAREFIFNFIGTALFQPQVARNRAQVGEDMTVAEGVQNSLEAGVGGAALGVGLHLIRPLVGAIGSASSSAAQRVYDALPTELKSRWKSPSAIPDAAIPEIAETLLGKDGLTPDMKAAVTVLQRGAEVTAASPFVPNAAGNAAHEDRLASGLATLHVMGDPDGAMLPGTIRSPVSQTVSRETVATALTPDRVIGFVLHDLEGGNAVVHYSQADGGTTKFGIAQKFNPGVDVANLSEAEARAIAHRKYWLPEFDHVDPRTAAVAFDAQYIGGAGERILRESGGDPARAIEAYRTYLNHLADTVPGKEKFRRGWNNRVDKLAALIGGDERLALRPDVSGDGDAVAASQRAIDDAETEARIAAFERDRAMGNTPEALPPEPRMASAADIGPLERSGIDPQTYGGNIANGDGATPQPLPPRTNLPDAPVANDVDIRNAVRAYVTQTRESLKPEIMAERLGIERDAVKAALNAIADLPGIGLRQRRPGVFARQQDAAPRDLLGFLADHGGIRNDEGHDLIKGRNLPRVAPSGGVLIRSKGMSIDRARELAAEAGYFHDAPPELGGDHITEDDMLQLIEHAVSTPHYARGDLETATAREAARARQTQFAAARETIANTLDTHGIAFTPVEHLRAADWVASGELTPGAAIARVVNDYARDALDVIAQEAENTRYADLADEFEHTLAARDHGAERGVGQSGLGDGRAGSGGARGEQPGGAAADAREEAGLNGPVLAEAPGPSLDDPNGPAGKAIAESLTHDVKAQIAEDVAFTTAKGSTYLVHSDGSTSRDKSFHPEHGAKDQGPQPRSQATIYVSASDAVKLAEFQAQGGPKVAIAVTSDGRWGLKYLEGKDVGRFERRTVVAAFKQPAVGLTPVEIWKDGERVHFGNEITEIRRGRDQHAAALDPNFPARERQRAQLKADSPIRAKTDQESTIGAPLFDAVDQGNMFRLEEGGPLRSAEDVLRELDADDAAIKAARNCL